MYSEGTAEEDRTSAMQGFMVRGDRPRGGLWNLMYRDRQVLDNVVLAYRLYGMASKGGDQVGKGLAKAVVGRVKMYKFLLDQQAKELETEAWKHCTTMNYDMDGLQGVRKSNDE